MTDGLDNVRKANVLRERAENDGENCQVFAVAAQQDLIMGRIRDPETAKFRENSAEDLARARYGTLEHHTTYLSEGHCSWFEGELNADIYVNGKGYGVIENGGAADPRAAELMQQLNDVFFS